MERRTEWSSLFRKTQGIEDRQGYPALSTAQDKLNENSPVDPVSQQMSALRTCYFGGQIRVCNKEGKHP